VLLVVVSVAEGVQVKARARARLRWELRIEDWSSSTIEASGI
jgi:hypothetical protein